MTGILDRVATSLSSASSGRFEPASPDELFALRLASKLNEAQLARHYVDLLEHYTTQQMLVAFHRSERSGSHLDPGRSFHQELERLDHPVQNTVGARRLLAIRIERRTIAAAIFVGAELEHPPLIRNLRKSPQEALASTASFIGRILQQCNIDLAAIEAPPEDQQLQRSALAEVVGHVLSEQAVGVCEIKKRDVIGRFAHPAPRFRGTVRAIISRMWPDVGDGFGSPLVKDALALGLYCQIESLFRN